MTWAVPYRLWHGSFLPLVPFEVQGVGILDALVDSGAMVSLFNVQVADALGIPVESGESNLLGGVGGRILAYRHDLQVRVMGQTLTLKVFHSDNDGEAHLT